MVREETSNANKQRIEEIYQLLCTGLRRSQILRFAQKKEWPETESEIDELIAEATDQLASAAFISVDAETGRSLERLNKLYQDAIKVQDHKTALSIVREINKLMELKVKAVETGTRARIGKLKLVK